jgi:hypothetical protein
MIAYDASPTTIQFAYVVINFDDSLHEYDRYQSQIDEYVANNPVADLEVSFDVKPAFYAAMA